MKVNNTTKLVIYEIGGQLKLKRSTINEQNVSSKNLTIFENQIRDFSSMDLTLKEKIWVSNFSFWKKSGN